MRRRVVVTGLGAVTPLGVGVLRTWSRLLDGHTAVTALTHPKYSALPSRIAALVPRGPGAAGGWTPGEWLDAGEERRMAVFTQYAVAAAREAMDDAGWRPRSEEESENAGVCIGSGIGSLDDVYDTSIAYDKGKGYKRVSPFFVPRLLINMAAGHISMKYGLKGPNHTSTTACTTGAHSILDATRLILLGDSNMALAGSSESCIHPLTIAGFARAKSLATDFNENPHQASRPFDRDRCGFVIGEGAGVLVLEELNHALSRSPRPRIYAEILGHGGSSSDAHHMTSPPPSGSGASLSMRRALRTARLPPSAVDYINAHATSTPLGDAAENHAIKDVMLGPGGKASPGEINVSSTKGAVGHLLGAAGAVEAIFTILAIYHNVIPPTLNLDNLSSREEFNCNYTPHTAQEREVNVALSNSFGFGGTNASLCFGKYRP